MTDRPITFRAPMVRALLDGRKSQHRVLLKPQPDTESDPSGNGEWGAVNRYGYWAPAAEIRPYAPGARIWVREGYAFGWPVEGNHQLPECNQEHAITYRADGNRPFGSRRRWHSPIHMPRWASRLTLIVTDVRVQRLHDISAADAIAEGCHVYASSATIDCDTPDPRQEYRRLWNSIHGPEAWAANPWVAALTFETHRQNIDQMEPTND